MFGDRVFSGVSVQISLLNMSGKNDEEVLNVVRAVNRQIADDFYPYWGQSAVLRLEGRASAQPDREKPPELRGDAILYLWNKADVPGVIGFHAENNAGLPFGFVFTELADQLDEPYSVTLSHEALELIGDANVNKLAAGPHPADPNRWVMHWYEMCDAVQGETYKVDGVDMSNFVLPPYFTPGEQVGARNDFLGRAHNGRTLQSFGVNPGGYLGFFDPVTGKMETWSAPGDAKAALRLGSKQREGLTRRSVRRANLPQLAVQPDLQSVEAERLRQERQLRDNWAQLRYQILDQFGQVGSADIDTAENLNDLVQRIVDKTKHSARYVETRLREMGPE